MKFNFFSMVNVEEAVYNGWRIFGFRQYENWWVKKGSLHAS